MSDDQLKNLHVQFMNMCSTDLIFTEKFDFMVMSLPESQKEILAATIHHPLATKYPPSSKYIKSFLKSLIQKIENTGAEVNEDLYSTYIELLSQNKNNDNTEICYKTYYVKGNESRITIQENVNLISNGTTGLHTWEAAIFLAEWCLQNKKIIEGKKVLELGCGSGFTGIAVIKCCQPSVYCFTDAHEKVLEQLKKNLRINKDEINSENQLKHDTTHDSMKNRSEDDSADNVSHRNNNPFTQVKKLDWTKINHHLDDFDVILAADVVYDPEVNPHLVRTLNQLLKPSSVAYVTCAIRNVETLQNFHTLLEQSGMSCELITEHVTHVFDYINYSSVKMWKLHKKKSS